MNTKWTRFILIFGVLLAIPASVWADDGNLRALIRKVGIHGNIGVRNPTDSDVTRGVSFGPSVGLAPGHTNGWKYPFALNMFSEYLHGSNGQQFGTVHTSALVGGIGYGWHFGQLSIGPDVEVGYAFNHASVTGDAGAFESSGPLSMHADNSWLIRPELKAEYFITRKLTFRTSVDYTRMQPAITVITPTGTLDNRWNLSSVHANVGVGFYPFRKK
jgi:hypothetical protein